MFLLRDQLDMGQISTMTEPGMTAYLQNLRANDAAAELLDGLFGAERKLYKRIAQFSCLENSALHEALARQPFDFLVAMAGRICSSLSELLGCSIADHEILVDAPPAKLEVQFHVDVGPNSGSEFRPLSEVSPVVQTLATRQFDDYVKRVRIFAHPALAGKLKGTANLDKAIAATVLS